MARREQSSHRYDRQRGPSLRNWQQLSPPENKQITSNAVLNMGWGRLIFGHTFEDTDQLLKTILEEEQGRRDITLYLRDPHVLLAKAPHRVFLDPSHTFRLWAESYQPSSRLHQGFHIRRIRTEEDAREIMRIYAARKMVTPDVSFMLDTNADKVRSFFIAESTENGHIIGTVMGADHVEAFCDPEKGSSLWCLAVDAQAQVPGVGESLVRHLCEHYFTRGRAHVDLSVMHDNTSAISLYEKLGFDRVPVFCVKQKNPINEPLFIAPEPSSKYNPYANIIIEEARRRGINVEPIDPEAGYFRLRLGGRSVVCRESLTELTSAIAMSRCDDKRITRRILQKAEIAVPAQILADDAETNVSFLEKHGSIVVKPARGEQGKGISVDIREAEAMNDAIQDAAQHADDVILEQFVEGEDLRIIVIGQEFVAAAVRRPPEIIGTGRHTIEQLLEKYNRRRAAATGGESRVPIDLETRRVIAAAGYELSSVLEVGESLSVRKTANLHTGGTIHDVTSEVSATLKKAAVDAATALDIPVVGLDFIVPDVTGDEYVIIEANERPGLANHEPAPTAQKFIDFLFPQSVNPIQHATN